jgi:hypothetical protein
MEAPDFPLPYLQPVFPGGCLGELASEPFLESKGVEPVAAAKLTDEQRIALVGWLAAEYTEPAIRRFLAEREWPVINGSSLQHYRERYRPEIEAARTQRRAAALTTGLALKDERVERLKQHADALEELKWVPDDRGKLHNEKAWRETLDDIAREMGHRKAGVEVSGPDGGAIEYRDVTNARQELGAELARTLATFGAGAVDPAPESEGGDESAL